jgi:hypothetical protein
LKLHDNKDEFIAVVQSAAKFFKIPDYVVEKDYWITKALLKLTHSSSCKNLVAFKGGTSLSKGYSLINRFSEDIDLALFPNAQGQQGFPNNAGRSLYKVIEEITLSEFQKDEDDKTSANRIYKRVFRYPTEFRFPENSVIHPKIVVEATLFGDPNPTERVQISSLVGTWLKDDGRHSELTELGLEPFEVLIATPEKTFCEKMLALMRRAEGDRSALAKRVRHFYDIHKLYQSPRIAAFLISVEKTKEHFEGAAKSDQEYASLFKDQGFDPDRYKLFQDASKILKSVEAEYNQLVEILFNEPLPPIDDVKTTIDAVALLFKKF